MFGLAGLPLVSTESLYYLRSNLPLLIVAMVGATPLIKRCALWLGKKNWSFALRFAVAALLLLVCTAYLVDGSFNPFLYFRF